MNWVISKVVLWILIYIYCWDLLGEVNVFFSYVLFFFLDLIIIKYDINKIKVVIFFLCYLNLFDVFFF